MTHKNHKTHDCFWIFLFVKVDQWQLDGNGRLGLEEIYQLDPHSPAVMTHNVLWLWIDENSVDWGMAFMPSILSHLSLVGCET